MQYGGVVVVLAVVFSLCYHAECAPKQFSDSRYFFFVTLQQSFNDDVARSSLPELRLSATLPVVLLLVARVAMHTFFYFGRGPKSVPYDECVQQEAFTAFCVGESGRRIATSRILSTTTAAVSFVRIFWRRPPLHPLIPIRKSKLDYVELHSDAHRRIVAES